MVAISLVTNTTRKQVFAETTETIKSVLDRNDVSLAGAQLLINGLPISNGEIGSSLANAGVADNSTAVFNVTTKAAAAAIHAVTRVRNFLMKI